MASSRVQILLVLAAACVAAGTSCLTVSSGEQTMKMEAYGANGIRVRAVNNTTFRDDLVSALIPPADGIGGVHPHSSCKTISTPATLTNGNLKADVGDDGRLIFTRVSDGRVLVEERNVRALTPAVLTPPLPGFFTLDLEFKAQEGERIYGLGQHQGNFTLDNKGRTGLVLNPHNTEVLIPVVHSSLGYVFLFNLPSFGTVQYDDTSSRWHADAVVQMDIWVATTPGDLAPSISPWQSLQASYANVTGHAPEFPSWSTGFWQCKNRYKNQTQIMDVIDGYHSRDIPVSMIIIDYYNWSPLPLGNEQLPQQCWPDPKAMVSQLAAQGVQLMLSPYFHSITEDSINYAAAKVNGYLVLNASKVPSPVGYDNSYTYDLFQQDARAFAFDAVTKGYISPYSLVNYWLDCDEPCSASEFSNAIYNKGQWPAALVGAAYPHVMYQMVHEQFPKSIYSDPHIVLGRSAWAGSQRFGAAVWSGDTHSSFDVLPEQFKAGLNMAMSGIPYWTTDIGGYSGGNIDDPVFRQLIVRWFQWGAFCPIFRLHGKRSGGPSQEGGDPTCGSSGSSNEIWNFGAEAEAAITKVILLRESLRSYISSLYRAAATDGTPVIRPLFFDFHEDEVASDIEDEMMFGPDYLVAPQMKYNAENRSVYLPQLTDGYVWENIFTKQITNTTTQAQTIVEATPLEGDGFATFPVYFRKKHVAPPPPPPLPKCDTTCAPTNDTDAAHGGAIFTFNDTDFNACCQLCQSHPTCGSFVTGPYRSGDAGTSCFLLGKVTSLKYSSDRTYGCVRSAP